MLGDRVGFVLYVRIILIIITNYTSLYFAGPKREEEEQQLIVKIPHNEMVLCFIHWTDTSFTLSVLIMSLKSLYHMYHHSNAIHLLLE